jgi:N6-L-threonylcarbamoyladenine synthase
MNILGIETSCDETAIAVVKNGKEMLSNVVASQIEIHRRFGGVVPEVASRQHVLQISSTISEAIDKSGISLDEIEAVAVTYGPGLAGALLVGVNTAKALAWALGVPLVGVNHLEGHVYATWLEGMKPDLDPGFPLLCLIASGGHTDLILMKGHGSYELLGRTRDDAAGEAFDKAARILGLGFPGGPEIQRVARDIRTNQKLPRAWLKGTHDFSFSGLKTALLHRAQLEGVYPVETMDSDEKQEIIENMAAAFQDSVVDVIVTKTLDAAREYKVNGVILGGGVTANLRLRTVMAKKSDIPMFMPSPHLCTDNGAMVGACGYFKLVRGCRSSEDLDIAPGLSLG